MQPNAFGSSGVITRDLSLFSPLSLSLSLSLSLYKVIMLLTSIADGSGHLARREALHVDAGARRVGQSNLNKAFI